jgi:hypothetical protein
VELAISKLRSGSYFPDWLLQHRRRAEQALVSVVATSYLLGVSTRRVEKLVEQLGVRQLSKSQVSQMATHLDVQVEAFRNRPLDSSRYTFVWMDALVIKVREQDRTVNVHALVAVGVNADGGREVLGLEVASDEDGAGWLAFLRSHAGRPSGATFTAPLLPADQQGDCHRFLRRIIRVVVRGLPPQSGWGAAPRNCPGQRWPHASAARACPARRPRPRGPGPVETRPGGRHAHPGLPEG